MLGTNQVGRYVMNYSVNVKNHFLQAWPILIPASIFLVAPLYFYYSFGGASLTFSINFSVIAFILLLLPQMVIHIRYWWLSKDVQVQIDTKAMTISYQRGSDVSFFSVKDIEKVETFVSRLKKREAIRWSSWDDYCYSIIYLKSGEKLLITSLLVPELNWPIDLPREIVHGTYYCWK